MRNIEFIKLKIGRCVCIDDSLFKSEEIKIKKIVDVLNIFSIKNLFVRSSCFVDEGEDFIDQITDINVCKIETLFTKTRLLSKKKYSKFAIDFKGLYFEKVLELVIKNDITFEAECIDETGNIVLQLDINNNDGTCIIFNTNKYNFKEVKEEIFKNFKKRK